MPPNATRRQRISIVAKLSEKLRTTRPLAKFGSRCITSKIDEQPKGRAREAAVTLLPLPQSGPGTGSRKACTGKMFILNMDISVINQVRETRESGT